MAVTIYSALRKGELIALRKSDVDLENRTILVHRSYERDTTKGGRPEVIPINSHCLPYLTEAILIAKGPLVFPNSKGKMRSRESDPHEIVYAALKAAGIDKKVGLHALRHSFATIGISQGAPLGHISRLMRHKRISTTMDLYGHLEIDHLREAAELISPKNSVAPVSSIALLPAVSACGSYQIRTDDPYRVKGVESLPGVGSFSQPVETPPESVSCISQALSDISSVVRDSCRAGVVSICLLAMAQAAAFHSLARP